MLVVTRALMFVAVALLSCNFGQCQTVIGYPQATPYYPVWKKMGTVNPHQQIVRRNPVWSVYNRNQPVLPPARGNAVPHSTPLRGGFGNGIAIAPQYVPNSPVPVFNQTPVFNQPLAVEQPANSLPVENPYFDSSIAPSSSADGLVVGDSLSSNTSDRNIMIEGEVVTDQETTANENAVVQDELEIEAPKDDRSNSASDEVAASDNESAPLNVELDSQGSAPKEMAETQEDNSQLAELEKQLQERESALSATQSELATVKEQQDRLKKMLEQSIVDTIKKKQDDEAAAKKLAEKVATKVKAEAERKIARAREEAELARKEAAAAKLEQQNLIAKLESIETQLKEAQKNKTVASSPASTAKSKPVDKNKMTLAKLAEQKRKERAAKQSSAENKSAEELSSDKTKSAKALAVKRLKQLNSEMEKQLDRAIGKIRKRFDDKIARAQNDNNASQVVAKLENEREIQMEKMEARIRNRFKKRIEEAKKDTK